MNQVTVRPSSPDSLISLVVAGRPAATQAAYTRHLSNFQAWSAEEGSRQFDRAAVMAWKGHLLASGDAAATVNQALSAVRAAAKEMRHYGLPESVIAGILEVPGVRKSGQRLGRWLSEAEVRVLLATPDATTLKGLQEKLVVGLLVGSAVRREEAAGLRVEDVQLVAGRPVIVNLLGKGNKTRSVPLPGWLWELVQAWLVAADITAGPLLRAVNKGGKLAGVVATQGGGLTDGGLSAAAVYEIVTRVAGTAGIGDLGPHSLRRTWARLMYQSDPSRLAQISLILGHSSMRTTEIYLGLYDVDLENPAVLELTF